MSIPGFSAPASLYQSSGHYLTSRHAVKSARQPTNAISIAEMIGEEVIHVHSCPSGFIEVGSGEDAFCTPGPGMWWDGQGGGDWPQPPDTPPGGGGGGGGMSVPPEIVAQCSHVCGPGKKYCCGGLAGPSNCEACAQLVCQQKKCRETGDCRPESLEETKKAECDGCPNHDGRGKCKDGLKVKKLVISGHSEVGGVFLGI